MDLILWRHAEAQEPQEPGDPSKSIELDLLRSLTGRGQKHASRMAVWLEQKLPENARIWVSPALRCRQTAESLGRKFRVSEQLGPDRSPDALIELAQWPTSRSAVLVVGHQPTLGRVAARLLNLPQTDLSVRKGAIWWLRSREREGRAQTLLLTVQSPDLL